MPDVLTRLRDALAGRYRVDRELGQGGMATVYLAHDERHDRPVAIKVLRPELAESLGSERFLREIRVAARLNHPNILALHDSGDAGGLLYYVMPLVTGESLSTRLRREGQLPLDEAIRIGAEVASALDYANRQGVVHRDIKPGNILLAESHALVADFGLAHALEQGETALTSSGLVVGTPMYMSPEQIGSAKFIDGRSDQYSLGCVIYEMLVGEPPFTGASVQHVFARHAVERVPSIRAVRDAVPEQVEAAVHRMLAKNPADRFPDCGEVARVLRGDSYSAWSRASMVSARQEGRRWRRWASVVLVILLLTIAGAAGWRAFTNRPHFLPLRDDRLAVLPFVAANTSDSVAANLGPALANLLADRFTGVGGPLAEDPSGVRAALARLGRPVGALGSADIAGIARMLGTGLVLRGQVLSSGQRVHVAATVESARSGTVLARVADVSGPPDSLTSMTDQLATALLLALAHGPPEQLAMLQQSPIGAVRSYLAGQAAYAGGRYTEALGHYKDAVAQDSSLTLAAMGWFMAAEVVMDLGVDRVITLLRGDLSRLPDLDRNFAACLDRTFTRERIADSVRNYLICERVAQNAPARADIWFQLGWTLYQQTWAGLAGARERAIAAFQQALVVDSTYVPALGHLLELEAWTGDTASVRRLGARYEKLDSTGDLAQYYRWLIAASLNDRAELARFRATLASENTTTLDRLISTAQVEGIRPADAMAAAMEMKRRSSLKGDLLRSYQRLQELALNRGRPTEAAALMREAVAAEARGLYTDFTPVFAALYWDGDTTLAAATVARLAPIADAAPSGIETQHDFAPIAVCAVELWRVAHKQMERVPAAIARLQRVESGTPGRDAVSSVPQMCAQVLQVLVANATRAPTLDSLANRLDRTVVQHPEASSWALSMAGFALARVYADRNDYARARDAVRRRVPVADAGAQRLQVALSSSLREEGRLALLAGDKEGAREAWGRFLALRDDPEPQLRPETDRIRAELARLE